MIGSRPIAALPIGAQPAASAGITGALVATDGADALVAAGVLTASGTLAQTDGTDSLSASGTLTSAGTLTQTDGADSLAASGTVGAASVAGDLAVTDGTDALSAAGTLTNAGTLALTDATDALVASGTVAASSISGDLSVTDGADVLVASGELPSTKIGGDDAPRAGRYQVQVRNKVHLFDTEEQAQAFMRSLSKKAKKAAVNTTLDPAYVQMMDAITADFDDEQDLEEILMLL